MLFKFLLSAFGGYFTFRSRYINAGKFTRKFYKIILKGVQHEFGAYLPIDNSILGPINFPHGLYGVFISGGSIIGRNCTMFQHVTIGSNMLIDSKGFGYPTIGDNCYIGAGAKIIGNVKIGNNCRIGANCVVTFDVPDNAVVVNEKPKIIIKDNLVNRNYQYTKTGFGYSVDGKIIEETNPEFLEKAKKSKQVKK